MVPNAIFFRKLLVASAVVAIRNFASSLDEYGSALKQFYFAVHPDFFEQYPAEKVCFGKVDSSLSQLCTHFDSIIYNTANEPLILLDKEEKL